MLELLHNLEVGLLTVAFHIHHLQPVAYQLELHPTVVPMKLNLQELHPMVVQMLEFLKALLPKVVQKVAFLVVILHMLEMARIIHQEDFN
jgi:hypothetical protein